MSLTVPDFHRQRSGSTTGSDDNDARTPSPRRKSTDQTGYSKYDFGLFIYFFFLLSLKSISLSH